MKRVLLFGDTHIPSRRNSIPPSFFAHIEKSEYDFALVTGDLVREVDMRNALPALPHCYIVQGNMDYTSYNHHEILKIEDFDFLLLHGTQLRPRGSIQELYKIAQQVNSDVTIHGHTHQSDITLYKDKLFLNPGTLSGATGGWTGVQDASFMEIEVSKTQIHVTLHLTDWRISKQSHMHFRKENDMIIAEK